MLSVLADDSTCFGALNGHTDIDLTDSHIKIDAIGQEALAFGGKTDDSRISVTDSDTRVVVRSALGRDTLTRDEDFFIKNGRHRFVINGEELERAVTINYT